MEMQTTNLGLGQHVRQEIVKSVPHGNGRLEMTMMPIIKIRKKVANVECDADSGGWKSRVDILELVTKDDAEVSIMPGKAGDAMCICDTFVISKATFEIPGINIACEQVLDQDPNSGDGGIEFGNGCAVLCDSHFMMYIECFKGKWKNTAEYPFMEVTEDDINC